MRSSPHVARHGKNPRDLALRARGERTDGDEAVVECRDHLLARREALPCERDRGAGVDRRAREADAEGTDRRRRGGGCGIRLSCRSTRCREGDRRERLVVGVLDAVRADRDDAARDIAAVDARHIARAIAALEHGARHDHRDRPRAVGGHDGVRRLFRLAAGEGDEALEALIVLRLRIGHVPEVLAHDAAAARFPRRSLRVVDPPEQHVDTAEAVGDRLEPAAADHHLGRIVGVGDSRSLGSGHDDARRRVGRKSGQGRRQQDRGRQRSRPREYPGHRDASSGA